MKDTTKMLNSEQNPEECDATDDASSPGRPGQPGIKKHPINECFFYYIENLFLRYFFRQHRFFPEFFCKSGKLF